MDQDNNEPRGTPWTPRKAYLWSRPVVEALRSALILNKPLDEFIGDGRNPAFDPDRRLATPVKKPSPSPPRPRRETYEGIPDAGDK